MCRYLFLVCGLALVVTPFAAIRAEDDPTIRNKKLSEWLKVLHDDQDPKQRQVALVIAMDVVGPKSSMVLPAVLKELKENSDPAIRVRCAERLIRFKASADKLIDPLIASLTGDPEGKVREAAATTIGKLEQRGFPGIKALTEALKDKHGGTRAAAGWSLAQFSSIDAVIAKDAVPDLINCLKDADAAVRMNAAYALGRMGPVAVEAVPELAAALVADKSTDVRKEVCKTLAGFGPKAIAAVPALIKTLGDAEADIRQQAAIALSKVGPAAEAALPDLLKSAHDKDKSVRCQAIHAIGSLGKAAVPAVADLIKIVKDDDVVDVKLAAIEELGGIGPDAKAALDVLQTATKDGRVSVREAAAEAIKKIQKSP